ncbi:hypothetical protein ABW20_dc0100171 [Dactylellina cionopaga]|nr:hypothetical protein ABW20_dc0100171 [Dactylellina cionopaga]
MSVSATPDSPPALPFLSKSTFSTAVNHLIVFLDNFTSLKHELKRSPYDESDVYIEITKFISAGSNNAQLEGIDTDADIDIDIDIDIEAEEDDPESLQQPPSPATHKVTYHILLSPIYSVPILYFNVYPLSSSSAIHSLPQIYSLLVPSSFGSTVSNIGVQGGISQTHHPYASFPVWFVHPCRTAEALREWGGQLSVENYMGVWSGIVGAVVGLDHMIRG